MLGVRYITEQFFQTKMPFLKGRTSISRSRQLENLTKKSGLRHAIFNTAGDKYVGCWKNNMKTGKGTILTREHQLYEGDLEDGYRHGFGILAHESENKTFILEYRGSWKKGRMHGIGLRKYKNGGVFIGQWKNGKREGYGLMWYPDGNFYAGEFLNDKRHGIGMLVHPDSSRYEGSWKEDLKHGRGKFYHFVTGQRQEGIWVNNVCVFCTFVDIYYRQSVIHPTKYTIPKIELLTTDEFCNNCESKALAEIVNSCLTIHESMSSNMNQSV